MAPAGHHRCPGYVRGVTGEVVRVPGGWPPPGEDGQPEATCTVRFALRDLWGDDAEPGWLCIDLWEPYLSRARATTATGRRRSSGGWRRSSRCWSSAA